MKTFQNIANYKATQKTIVTIGTFDGVHLGHKKILEKVVDESLRKNCESLILTFFPHPRMVLHENSEIKLLNTIVEKTELLEKNNIDNLIIHPFDKEFSNLSADEFVKNILVDIFNIQKIIIGHDHRFGKNRTADINDLIEFGEKYAFEVEQISAEELHDIAISSTKIRTAIRDGNCALANQCLGYNYFFSGKVVRGMQLGRTIGFPTANIQIEENYKLIPKNGVYIVKSIIDNQVVNGIMNIGNRPTINGENQTVEVHFFDFDKDIYGKIIRIELLEFIRDEEKFSSLDALKIQIEKDKNTALSFNATFRRFE